MTLSMVLAWLMVICGAMAAFKYIARISKNKSLNRFFHKCHIPFGVLMLVFGLAHALLAGNPAWTTMGEITLAPLLFTWNWGTGCLALSILLALSYLLRKKLGRAWMAVHRVLTVLLIAMMVLHLVNMGVQLPSRIFGGSQTQTSAAASSSASGVTFSGAVLKDGTYQGSAQGYGGTTTVSVTVSGGKVTDIAIVSENDMQEYFSRAQSLTDTIVSSQSLEVDAVSGATFSSAGIINATANALQDAVVSGTLQVNSIDVSSIPHGH
jgi:uncharacterized protein with FMN-binding domain